MSKMVHHKVTQLRKKKGMTMRELADAVGTSQQQIDRLEKGKRRMTLDWIYSISKALDCDLIDLLPADYHPHSGRTARARVVGKLKDGQVEWLEDTETYCIIFGRPKNSKNLRMFAIYIEDDSIAEYPVGTELVFSEFENKAILNDTELKNGKVALCSYKRTNKEEIFCLSNCPVESTDKQPKAILIKSLRDE